MNRTTDRDRLMEHLARTLGPVESAIDTPWAFGIRGPRGCKLVIDWVFAEAVPVEEVLEILPGINAWGTWKIDAVGRLANLNAGDERAKPWD